MDLIEPLCCTNHEVWYIVWLLQCLLVLQGLYQPWKDDHQVSITARVMLFWHIEQQWVLSGFMALLHDGFHMTL